MTQDNNPEMDIKVHHQAERPSLVWELLIKWHWALCTSFFFFFLRLLLRSFSQANAFFSFSLQ